MIILIHYLLERNIAYCSQRILTDPDYSITGLKLCESPIKPITQTLRERTVATWTSFPILNALFLQFQDLLELKWIEVLHSELENSKIDRLSLKRSGKSMILIIELAGGIETNTETKLESDTLKIYKNSIKVLKNDNDKIFIVLYYENTLYFESLTIQKQHYIIKMYLKLQMPKNARELKLFAAQLPTMLSWR